MTRSRLRPTAEGRSEVRLNIGCGTDRRVGYINCDIDPRVADLVFDLARPPYPFTEGSVDAIVANQVLEHMPDLPDVLDGLHKTLRVGGRLSAQVPHFSSYGAMGHYDHKTTFHFNSLAWCDIGGSKTDMVHDARLWHFVDRRLIFAFKPRLLAQLCSWLFNRHKYIYTTTGLAFLFPALLIEFVMEKPTPDEELEARERWVATHLASGAQAK